jgi:hypothetical protein
MGKSDNYVRYIIRSKDRLNPTTKYGDVSAYLQNSPADFQVMLNPPLEQNREELWVKIINACIPTVPYGVIRGRTNVYALDTNSYVDMCLSIQQSQTVDTEVGIAEKTPSDRTFALLPYDPRANGILLLANQAQSEWIKCRRDDFSRLQVKLFSDTGLQLYTRLNTGNTSTIISAAMDTSNNFSASIFKQAGVYQQLTLSFATAKAVKRGDTVGVGAGGSTDITTYISGAITVLSIFGSYQVTIGFQSQNIADIPNSTGSPLNVSFRANASGMQPQSIQDWSFGLLVSSVDPLKTRVI